MSMPGYVVKKPPMPNDGSAIKARRVFTAMCAEDGFMTLSQEVLLQKIAGYGNLQALVTDIVRSEFAKRDRFKNPVQLAILSLAIAFKANDVDVGGVTLPKVRQLIQCQLHNGEELVKRLLAYVKGHPDPLSSQSLLASLAEVIFTTDDCAPINAVLCATDTDVKSEKLKALSLDSKAAMCFCLRAIHERCDPRRTADYDDVESHRCRSVQLVQPDVAKIALGVMTHDNPYLSLVKILISDNGEWFSAVRKLSSGVGILSDSSKGRKEIPVVSAEVSKNPRKLEPFKDANGTT